MNGSAISYIQLMVESPSQRISDQFLEGLETPMDPSLSVHITQNSLPAWLQVPVHLINFVQEACNQMLSTAMLVESGMSSEHFRAM